LLARSALRTIAPAVAAVAAGTAYLLGVDELIALFGGAIAYGLWQVAGPRVAAFAVNGLALAQTVRSQVELDALLFSFLKIGALLYGSGYVLLAFLQDDLVERLGWLTREELLDAVSIGQVTPGPLFTTATFIGYVLAGLPGALVATAGIFAPSFVFAGVVTKAAPRIRSSPVASAFLDGVNACALGLMGAVTIELVGAAFVDVPTAIIGAVAAVVLLRFELNSAWLVLAGGAAGLLLSAVT
jgi:chromate transporter